MSELAWAAGFFDGEGNTHYSKSRKNVVLSIAQTRLEPLQRFQAAICMGRIYGPYKPKTPRSKPYWSLFTYGQDTVSAYHKLKPFLCSIKRAQAENAIAAYFEHKSKPRKLRCDIYPTLEQLDGLWHLKNVELAKRFGVDPSTISLKRKRVAISIS